MVMIDFKKYSQINPILCYLNLKYYINNGYAV